MPVIAMTTYAMAEDQERFREAGMDGYASKPLRLAQLPTTIEEVLSIPARK